MRSWQPYLSSPTLEAQGSNDLMAERVKLQADLKMTQKGSHDLEFLTVAKKRHVRGDVKHEAWLCKFRFKCRA